MHVGDFGDIDGMIIARNFACLALKSYSQVDPAFREVDA